MTPIYIIVRPDNYYPLLCYEDQTRAEEIARKNGYRLLVSDNQREITK